MAVFPFEPLLDQSLALLRVLLQSLRIGRVLHHPPKTQVVLSHLRSDQAKDGGLSLPHLQPLLALGDVLHREGGLGEGPGLLEVDRVPVVVLVHEEQHHVPASG